MPALAFTLELVDKVSASAKKATESVKKVEEQSKKAQKALDFAPEVQRLQAQLDKLKVDPKGFQQMVKLRKELAQQQSKLKDQLNPQGFFSSFTKALPFRTVGQYTQAAAAGILIADGVMKAGSLLVDAAHKVVDVIVEGFKKGVEAGSKQEVLRLGERLSLGKGAKSFAADADRFAGMTGFDDDVIRSLLLPLRRAGFDQQAARSAFAGAADIAAGLGKGGDQGTVADVLDTFTKIKLKGGIASKQLVGLGVSPKEVYADVAKQLGIDAESAEKKIEEGKIDDPQRIINAILRGVEARQGGQLGTGSIEYSKTFEAKWRKITELPENYLKKLVDSPAWGKLTEAATRFLEFMDPSGPTGQRVFASLEATFSRIIDLIDTLATPEGMKQFALALESAADIAKSLAGAVATIAEGLMKVSKAAEWVVKTKYGLFHSTESNLESQGYNSPESQKGLLAQQFAAMWGLTDMATPAPRASVASKTTKSVTVAPTTHVHVNGASGSPEDVGRRAGRAAGDHIARVAERAANEAGAM